MTDHCKPPDDPPRSQPPDQDQPRALRGLARLSWEDGHAELAVATVAKSAVDVGDYLQNAASRLEEEIIHTREFADRLRDEFDRVKRVARLQDFAFRVQDFAFHLMDDPTCREDIARRRDFAARLMDDVARLMDDIGSRLEEDVARLEDFADRLRDEFDRVERVGHWIHALEELADAVVALMEDGDDPVQAQFAADIVNLLARSSADELNWQP